jgi:hypothetical protein
VSDRAELLARIEALERESHRAFDAAQREADALFAQYQLSQLVAAGGSLESVARSVTAEVVRLAAVDSGALWFGAPESPGGPELTLLASVGGGLTDDSHARRGAALGRPACRGPRGRSVR